MQQADILLWLGAEGAGPTHVNLLEIAAKCDIIVNTEKSADAITVSAQTGAGIAELLHIVAARAKTLLPPPDQFAINARQRAYLEDAATALAACSDSADWLIIAENLRQARRALDALTGRAHTEDLLDTIFGKFCVGK
jgi:tRNA modification GTPase